MSLEVKSIESAYLEELDYIEKRFNREIGSLKTPWDSWNSLYMDGWEWGWIITLAGRSGAGKTTLWNQLETGFFEHNPSEDFEILSFNFEMVARRLIGRKISGNMGKTVKEIYSADGANDISKEDLAKIQKEIREKIAKYPLHYVEIPGTPAQIAATIMNFIETRLAKSNKGLIVSLDHASLVRSSQGQSERSTLISLMSMFNKMKKVYPKSMYVILSQLNRDIESPDRQSTFGEKRALHYPQRGDIFGSDALYQFSDAVIVAHRPEQLGLKAYGMQNLPTKDMMYCHHLKNRDGESAITRMYQNLRINKLEEIR